MTGARQRTGPGKAGASHAVAEGRKKAGGDHARAVAGPQAVLAWQRTVGNAAVTALMTARLKSPGDQEAPIVAVGAAHRPAPRAEVTANSEGIFAVSGTIRQLVGMLTNVLPRAAGVVGEIIKNPAGFLGNLIAGVKGGILKFKDNILGHLRRGLMSWLFGALAAGGIELPDTFDARGIIRLLASIFGLTWTNIRNRIVRQIGDKAMAAAEKGVEIFQVIAAQGIAGLWQMLIDKFGDIKEMILEQAKDFVVTKIIAAGITWLIGLLNPAAAFIKACKLIYDVVMFFVDNASRIQKFVDTVIDSVADIVRGDVSGVVDKINDVLGQMVPIIIGFLASAIGLGGIGDKIREIVQALQKQVNQALDSIIKTGLRQAAPIIRGLRSIKNAFLAKLMGRQTVTMVGNSHSVFLEVHGGKHVVMMASAKSRLIKKLYYALRDTDVREDRDVAAHLKKLLITVMQYEEDIDHYKFVDPNTEKAREREAKLEAYSNDMISQLAMIGEIRDLEILRGGEYVLDGHVHPAYVKRIREFFYGSADDYEHHRAPKRQEAINAKLAINPDPLANPDKFWCPGYAPGKRAPHLASFTTFQLDHKEGVASHWSKLGKNSTQAVREQFFADGSNIQAMCSACNAAKGSEGHSFGTAVGLGFSGPLRRR